MFGARSHLLKLPSFQKEGPYNTMTRICGYYSPILSSKATTATEFRSYIVGKAKYLMILRTVICKVQTGINNQRAKASSSPCVRVRDYGAQIIHGSWPSLVHSESTSSMSPPGSNFPTKYILICSQI